MVGPGTRLGHYEIVESIGAGGMGEVYRARDTRLDRTVAIKVLPEHLSENNERRQRFEQEARAVSKLNHPNICTLHDIGSENGVDFMVMEHIEGETLADRLHKGALPLDDALRCAVAIGDALDKAHRQGIVHRDLKPGNVMLTKSGPKLLDFGLAKLHTKSNGEPDLSAVTEQKPLTEEGAILGTFQYMAPEQLEGSEVDARTDIFAFGALVYEMVTGQKAFSGKSQASLISAILSSEPEPITELRPMTPWSLDRIVKRCLAKDPEDRWQSARDIVMQLESVGDEDEKAVAPVPPSRARERLVWIALLVATALVVGFWISDTTAPRVQTARAVIPLPAGDQLMGGSSVLGSVSSVAISPDGGTIAYVAESGGDSKLYLRRLNELESTSVTGTEGANMPFFSPDGQWVGFRSGGKLRKSRVDGVVTVDIHPQSGPTFGASWDQGGAIVVGLHQRLSRVSEETRSAQTFGDSVPSAVAWPQVIPGGKHVLVSLLDLERVAVVSTGTGNLRTLIEGYGGARYIRTGHLVVGDPVTRTLLAVPFDLERLDVEGTPVPVVDDVYVSPRSGLPHYSVSETGTLVYVPEGEGGNALVWVDRQGNVVETLGIERGAYGHPRLSPDGTRVAVDNFERADRNIWVYDIARGSRVRLNTDFSGIPSWTPDGSRVAFYSSEGGLTRLDWRAADASTDAETLLAGSEFGLNPISWSPDGATLAYAQGQPEGGRDIFLLSPGGEPEPLLATSFNERSPTFSPDGRYLAYVSDDSGRSEVYVRPYPEGDQKWPVSTDGGQEPVWSPKGNELFYRKDYKMLVVPVELGADFRAGRPRELFDAPYYTDTSGHPAYDVSSDGERFLMIQDTEDERTQINIVFNWFAELERLVPTGN